MVQISLFMKAFNVIFFLYISDKGDIIEFHAKSLIFLDKSFSIVEINRISTISKKDCIFAEIDRDMKNNEFKVNYLLIKRE